MRTLILDPETIDLIADDLPSITDLIEEAADYYADLNGSNVKITS